MFKIGNIEIAFILVYLWYINIKEEINKYYKETLAKNKKITKRMRNAKHKFIK